MISSRPGASTKDTLPNGYLKAPGYPERGAVGRLQRVVGHPIVWRLSSFDVVAKPIRKGHPAQITRCNLKDNLDLFIHTGVDVMIVQNEECFQSCMTRL